MTAILKGVQSINNCWGGEGPVFNPDYMCGAQYMITQGKDHNYFFLFVLIEIYFYDTKFFMILIRHSWKKMWNFLFAYWTGAFQAFVRIRRFVFDLRRVRSLCCWQIFDHWFLRAHSGNIKKYKSLTKPYVIDSFNFLKAPADGPSNGYKAKGYGDNGYGDGYDCSGYGPVTPVPINIKFKMPYCKFWNLNWFENFILVKNIDNPSFRW